MTDPGQNDLTHDAYLGGRLRLYQPRHGYRAGLDAVLLSASVCAEKGQQVLELGCGVGAAILCLGTRVSGLTLTGVERDPAFAALARRNGRAALEVVEADLADLPLDVRQRQFDHVLATPPIMTVVPLCLRMILRAKRPMGRKRHWRHGSRQQPSGLHRRARRISFI